MFFAIVGIIVVIIIIGVIVTLNKQKNQGKQLLADERLKNAKLFKMGSTPIAISEDGFIGCFPGGRQKIFNIKEINGFDLVVDGQNVANIGGAVVGGLLFGGVGAIIGGLKGKEKISKMNLLFKTNDFNNPAIEIPLLAAETKKGSLVYEMLQKEITEIMATLEFVEKNAKNA